MYMQTGCFHETGRAAWRACQHARLRRFEGLVAVVVVVAIATALAVLGRGIVSGSAKSPPLPVASAEPRMGVQARASGPRDAAAEAQHFRAPASGGPVRLSPPSTYEIVSGDITPLGEAANVSEARALSGGSRTDLTKTRIEGDAAEVAPLATADDPNPYGGIRRVVGADGSVTYTNQ